MPAEILVVREKDCFSSILIEQGFSVINFPTIKTEPLADLSELENYLAKIETFDGIFITSSKAAEIVLAKFGEKGKTFHKRFFVLGKRSADLLRNAGYEIFFSEKATTAAEFLESIPKEELKNKRFLFPRGNRSLRTIPEKLAHLAEVVETIVYHTGKAEMSEQKLIEITDKFKRGEIAAVCFFSPSGAEEFLEKFENFSQGKIKIAAIGKTTAQFIEANNLKVNFVATKPESNNFAAELSDFLERC